MMHYAGVCRLFPRSAGPHLRRPGGARRRGPLPRGPLAARGGGGGRTRVLADGGVFEKAGVNFSDVHGQMSEEFARQVPGEGRDFTATGISLVLHPRSPLVPTVHANFRFLTKGERVVRRRRRPDAVLSLSRGRDPLPPRLEAGLQAPRASSTTAGSRNGATSISSCRTATRPAASAASSSTTSKATWRSLFAFVRDCGDAFLDAYLPIARRRKDEPYTDRERAFQEFRRGRYVEFNLLYDRGTLFGLKTGGRTESILMSLPPVVRWQYDYQPEPGSREAELYEYLKPRDWAGELDP